VLVLAVVREAFRLKCGVDTTILTFVTKLLPRFGVPCKFLHYLLSHGEYQKIFMKNQMLLSCTAQ
jgi:hypothetical protein